LRFLVDTNVLVYLAHTASPEHSQVKQSLSDRLANGAPWCLTWGIVYEFLRVATHPRVFARPMTAPEAVQFINGLLERDEVSVLMPTERHWATFQKTVAELARPAGNLFHDIETAVLAREHGVPEIITADTDFLQFSFLKVTSPLRSAS
jgi:toxin-antitoxin system PIN domain toxin